jgi:hypothetical protein
MFSATRLTSPAGTVCGTARSIMCAPNGAVLPIIWVVPMSPSVTMTARPGRSGGAVQVNLEKWYPDPDQWPAYRVVAATLALLERAADGN